MEHFLIMISPKELQKLIRWMNSLQSLSTCTKTQRPMVKTEKLETIRDNRVTKILEERRVREKWQETARRVSQLLCIALK